MKFKQLPKLTALAAIIAATPVMALTQGTIGPTSQGDVIVSVTIPSLIRVDGLADIPLGIYDGTPGGLIGASDAAVCTNGTNLYGVTISSTTGFNLTSLSGTIPYSVSWGASTWSSAVGDLASGTLSSGQAVAVGNTNFGTCAVEAGKLSVTVPEAGLNAAMPDFYTDTVTILVTPE